MMTRTHSLILATVLVTPLFGTPATQAAKARLWKKDPASVVKAPMNAKALSRTKSRVTTEPLREGSPAKEVRALEPDPVRDRSTVIRGAQKVIAGTNGVSPALKEAVVSGKANVEFKGKEGLAEVWDVTAEIADGFRHALSVQVPGSNMNGVRALGILRELADEAKTEKMRANLLAIHEDADKAMASVPSLSRLKDGTIYLPGTRNRTYQIEFAGGKDGQLGQLRSVSTTFSKNRRYGRRSLTTSLAENGQKVTETRRVETPVPTEWVQRFEPEQHQLSTDWQREPERLVALPGGLATSKRMSFASTISVKHPTYKSANEPFKVRSWQPVVLRAARRTLAELPRAEVEVFSRLLDGEAALAIRKEDGSYEISAQVGGYRQVLRVSPNHDERKLEELYELLETTVGRVSPYSASPGHDHMTAIAKTILDGATVDVKRDSVSAEVRLEARGTEYFIRILNGNPRLPASITQTTRLADGTTRIRGVEFTWSGISRATFWEEDLTPISNAEVEKWTARFGNEPPIREVTFKKYDQ